MSDIDDILADLQAETTVEQSVIVFLNSINAQLKAAGNDPTKVAAVRALIASNKAALAAAIVANTPVAAPAAGGVGVTVMPAAMTISNGSSGQLSVDDSTGKDITSTALYTSSDPTTASVTAAGLVTGNKAGTESVTVTDAAGANPTVVLVTVV
jgi:transcription initiation factor TFIIIB Brf1 subunit/transcription initiation factor TFIIB